MVQNKGRGLGSRHETDQGRTLMLIHSGFLRTGVLPTRILRSKTSSQSAAGIAMAAALAVTSAFTWALAPAHAQEAVKIGLILPMTGGQASTGKQIDNAIKLYMQQNGDTVAGKKIEVILKDDAALPDNTKRLAQELIVNDKVSFIAGFGVTPAALAAT